MLASVPVVGFYSEHVLPRLVELTCGSSDMERWRRRAADGLSGTVLEIGSGSGMNLEVYPDAVDRVLAVEPNTVARARAARRHERTRPGLPVEHVGLDGASIPLPDASCDGALSTFVLCTIPDVDRALHEVRRVLRPGGALHFLEHGRSPDEGVRRWQHRFEPTQKRLAGGCHLTRDVPALLTAAGFEVEQLQQRYARGPRPWTWFSLGVATVPT